MSDLQRHTPPGHRVIPRANLDFGLDGDIPKYWFGGDPFKTRFFDAMSLLFPEGERFFIECVRDYRDQITDPELKQQVRDFIFQEGQHGMVHTRFNNRIKAQGVEVDRILQVQKDIMFGYFRRKFPRSFTLGQTAAAEHLTALMAHGFFHKDFMQDADPRIRAMYSWHAIEEVEHKAVAYDVLKKVAKAGYFTRIASFMLTTFTFPFHVFMIMRHMFKVDGIRNTLLLWLRGLWWLYGWGGLYPRLMPHYLAYFLPGFHPWKFGRMDIYHTWVQAFADAGENPIAASDALFESASTQVA